MSLPKVNLVVIGHKDHGKSTLIGRLLYDSNAIPEQKLQEVEAELKKAGDEGFRFAFLLDTLEEERRGGLTIDIVQIPFKSKRYQYTIIDCPGHKEFVKKMFTGASQADAAVLVVSAKEGIQDQTKQHALLIKTLGIQQLVVAVNKMDSVEYAEPRFIEICNELEPILDSLGYRHPPIVPLSALVGENVYKESSKMSWYKGSSLVETLDNNVRPAIPPFDKPLRASVQDIYSLGDREVIACKILTGTLEQGQRVRFEPAGKEGVITGIEMFGKEIGRARPGDSIGVVMDRTLGPKRGDVMSDPHKRAKAPKSFTAEVILFSNYSVSKGDVVAVRCGTAEQQCRVQDIIESIDPITITVNKRFPAALESDEIGMIKFMPIVPICLETFSEFPELGRFVIVDRKGAAAAGIILEARA